MSELVRGKAGECLKGQGRERERRKVVLLRGYREQGRGATWKILRESMVGAET